MGGGRDGTYRGYYEELVQELYICLGTVLVQYTESVIPTCVSVHKLQSRSRRFIVKYIVFLT